MSIIEDGKGTGKKASVTNNNRLDVSSRAEDRIFYSSRDDKKAFSVYGKRNFASGSQTNENVLYVKYIGNGHLYVKDIMFSSNSSDAKVEVYFDPTSVSGGSTIIPLNMNRTSAITSETTCLTGNTDLSAAIIPANEMFDVRLNKSSFIMDFHCALILPKNAEILILGSVASTDDKIRTMIYFYEDV
jgi:hypothetical protein